jgi:predicted O-linked N-acetylglucosamine transferase (SPINDLY family)
MGLPETDFVFCCFNNNFKISPSTFATWMNILKAVPKSVLWLLADNPVAQVNLIKNASHQGIDPQRLIFGQRMEASEYLARYKTADLFLDTWPYNAGTTASDALLVGLPVLTLQGQSFPARMASSVLMGLGLPELITETVQDYQDRAIALATNPSHCKALREKVLYQQKTGLLFNSPAFTQSLERGMVHALERATQGLGPHTFHVNDLPNASQAC